MAAICVKLSLIKLETSAAMKINKLPEKYLEMLKYAEEILEANESSPLTVIVTTAKGKLMGFASRLSDTDRIADENRFLQSLAEHGEAKISCGLCKWRNGNVDIPSANLRKKLEELNSANLEAEFLLQGVEGFQLRSLRAMRYPA